MDNILGVIPNTVISLCEENVKPPPNNTSI